MIWLRHVKKPSEAPLNCMFADLPGRFPTETGALGPASAHCCCPEPEADQPQPNGCSSGPNPVLCSALGEPASYRGTSQSALYQPFSLNVSHIN